jgi:hypothetical protein
MWPVRHAKKFRFGHETGTAPGALGAPEVNKQPTMDHQEAAGDSAWQSLRLALGAIVLIAGGLGLMLADGTIHPSKALSSVFVSSNSQSK